MGTLDTLTDNNNNNNNKYNNDIHFARTLCVSILFSYFFIRAMVFRNCGEYGTTDDVDSEWRFFIVNNFMEIKSCAYLFNANKWKTTSRFNRCNLTYDFQHKDDFENPVGNIMQRFGWFWGGCLDVETVLQEAACHEAVLHALRVKVVRLDGVRDAAERNEDVLTDTRRAISLRGPPFKNLVFNILTLSEIRPRLCFSLRVTFSPERNFGSSRMPLMNAFNALTFAISFHLSQ